MFFFQAPNMGPVGQIGQSMSAGSPNSYVPLGEGPAYQQGVNVGAAVVAPQERGAGNMALPQQTRLIAAAGTLGKCESKLFDQTAGFCGYVTVKKKKSNAILVTGRGGLRGRKKK
jgi:hypothetical protein